LAVEIDIGAADVSEARQGGQQQGKRTKQVDRRAGKKAAHRSPTVLAFVANRRTASRRLPRPRRRSRQFPGFSKKLRPVRGRIHRNSDRWTALACKGSRWFRKLHFVPRAKS